MPFQSEKQRRYLWATQPDLAKRWAKEYPESNKGLPMYAKDNKAKKKSAPQQGGEKRANLSFFDNLTQIVKNRAAQHGPTLNNLRSGSQKTADSKQERVEIPHSEKPTYAGEERAKGLVTQEFNDQGGNVPNGAPAGINALLQKLSVVLSPKMREMLAARQAQQQGQQPGPVPQNQGIKQYPAPSPVPPPMGMQPQQAGQQPQQPQPQQAQQPATPQMQGVGGGTTPNANPINSYGGLSTSGDINGNAAFGTQNAVGSRKFAAANTPCSCGCGDTVATCKCGPECKCRKPGGSCYKSEKVAGNKPGLWANIHAKRKRGEKPAKPGDKDYPDSKSWNATAKQADDAASELSPAWRSLLGAGLFGGIGLRGGALAGGVAGLGHGLLATPGEYVDAKGEKKKQTRLQKVLHDAFAGVGMGAAAGGVLGAAGGAALPLLPTKQAGTPAWQRSAGKNPEGGLNEQGRKSYERETGGNLKAPVTESNPSGERAKRQNSFCSRMCGMKRVNTGSKTKSDPDSRINKSLRKWNCKCSSFQKAVEKWAGVVKRAYGVMDDYDMIERTPWLFDDKTDYKKFPEYLRRAAALANKQGYRLGFTNVRYGEHVPADAYANFLQKRPLTGANDEFFPHFFEMNAAPDNKSPRKIIEAYPSHKQWPVYQAYDEIYGQQPK